MHIENEVKYDFSDVLIKPKRSYYTSRKEVDLERKFRFKWSNMVWKGIPIAASNMDTVGTVGTAKVLSKHNTLTCLHKFHTVDELLNIPVSIRKNAAITIGIAEGLSILYALGEQLKHFKLICIDVANGYTEQFSEFIKKVLLTTPIYFLPKKDFFPQTPYFLITDNFSSDNKSNLILYFFLNFK